MKIILVNTKFQKYILDLLNKIKKKSHKDGANSDDKVVAAADDDAVIIDDNNDGIELLSVLESLSSNDAIL